MQLVANLVKPFIINIIIVKEKYPLVDVLINLNNLLKTVASLQL